MSWVISVRTYFTPASGRSHSGASGVDGNEKRFHLGIVLPRVEEPACLHRLTTEDRERRRDDRHRELR